MACGSGSRRREWMVLFVCCGARVCARAVELYSVYALAITTRFLWALRCAENGSLSQMCVCLACLVMRWRFFFFPSLATLPKCFFFVFRFRCTSTKRHKKYSSSRDRFGACVYSKHLFRLLFTTHQTRETNRVVYAI